MLKLSSILLVVTALLIAGCGGGGGGGDAESPLDEALRYLPADTPFAVAIDTDTKGDQYQAAGDIADRFGAEDQLTEQLEQSLDAEPGEIEKLEKALGNEFVVGSTNVRNFVNQSSDEDQSFVGAIQAADKSVLEDLLAEQGGKEQGKSNGATIYKDDDGDDFAIEDDVLIVAGNRKELDQALATRDGDDGLTEEDFEAGVEGLPSDALLRVYVNIEELLRVDPDAKQALRSKWVNALTTGGITLAVEQNEVAVDFNVKTEGDLTDDDLPIAAGGESPEILDRDGSINLALRDPAQILNFAIETAGQVQPGTEVEASRKQLETALGVDVETDVLDQMEDGIAVSVDLDGTWGARGELKNPQQFERTLEKLSAKLPDMLNGLLGGRVGFAKPRAGEDFYAVATADGNQVVFGVVDDVFVISNDPKVAGSLAAEGTTAVQGAKGSLVVGADAEQLARDVLEQVAGIDLGPVDRLKNQIGTRPLDQGTGSIESSTSGLSGSFKLTLDE